MTVTDPFWHPAKPDPTRLITFDMAQLLAEVEIFLSGTPDPSEATDLLLEMFELLAVMSNQAREIDHASH